MSLLEFADIDEQCTKDKQLKREDIAQLEEWQNKQPHLPSPLHPTETALFLHSCYYSNEAAKQCIDAYYTFRTHCPDFFARRDPFSPEVQKGLNTLGIFILPNLTPEGYMVIYGQLVDRNPNAFHYNTMWKIIDMVMSLATKTRGCQEGVVAVLNLEGLTMAHLLKWNVIGLKHGLTYLQNALPVRMKSINYVNGVPFMDKILALVKPFLKKDFKTMINVHFGNNETIFKFVPKNLLPIECGGDSFCAEDYYKNVVRKEIERHSEFFKVEEKQLTDETKRPGVSKNILDLCGIQGTFKKLNID